MKLRYVITCNKNGRKSEPCLQFWNTQYKRWENIPVFECEDWEYDDSIIDPDAGKV